MRSGFRFAALVFCFAFVGVPAFAEGVLTKVPSALVERPKEFWRAFMVELYGPYNKAKKCWIGKHEGAAYCMRPHTFATVDQDGKARLFLSVAGGVAKDGNDCHACNGNISYYVLDPSSERIAIVAQSEAYLPSGSWGAPVPEDKIQVRLIGPNSNYGWVVEGFYMGQGISVSNYEIVGVLGDKIRSLGMLPASYSDQGNCDNGKNLTSGEPCTDYAFEIIFDTSKPDRFSPIIMRASGTSKGADVAASYSALFDEKESSYKLPTDLPADLQN